MVNIRNIKRKDTLLHIVLGKAFGYLGPLGLLHDYNYISPIKLFFSYWVFIIKASRLGIKSAFKSFFSCFAPVLVLVADEKYIHSLMIGKAHNLNVSVKVVDRVQ
ncbi:hypothetical protein J4234_03105 [Candidatus Woesearchaeota archaeon]|nr:hypothetical protein [Candidatus Woesearchaeota archaeon]